MNVEKIITITDEQYQYILANKDKLYDKYKGIVFLKK